MNKRAKEQFRRELVAAVNFQVRAYNKSLDIEHFEYGESTLPDDASVTKCILKLQDLSWDIEAAFDLIFPILCDDQEWH
jgi:hypothetical protein